MSAPFFLNETRSKEEKQMRMVNGADVLGASGHKIQARGSRAVNVSPRQNFSALTQQIAQRKSATDGNATLSGALVVKREKSQNILDTANNRNISVNESAFLAKIAELTDPKNNFNNILNRDYIKELENRDWYDKNKLRNDSGNSWENSFKDIKGSINSFYNQIVAAGRATSEITARYEEAVVKLDAHEKERVAGKEFSPPESFNRLFLRSEVPLSKEEIRNRIAEALKRPGGVMAFTQK
jgi:hypothetical protein